MKTEPPIPSAPSIASCSCDSRIVSANSSNYSSSSTSSSSNLSSSTDNGSSYVNHAYDYRANSYGSKRGGNLSYTDSDVITRDSDSIFHRCSNLKANDHRQTNPSRSFNCNNNNNNSIKITASPKYTPLSPALEVTEFSYASTNSPVIIPVSPNTSPHWRKTEQAAASPEHAAERTTSSNAKVTIMVNEKAQNGNSKQPLKLAKHALEKDNDPKTASLDHTTAEPANGGDRSENAAAKAGLGEADRDKAVEDEHVAQTADQAAVETAEDSVKPKASVGGSEAAKATESSKPTRPSTLLASAPCFTPRKLVRGSSGSCQLMTAGSYEQQSATTAAESLATTSDATYNGSSPSGGEYFCDGAPPLPSFVFAGHEQFDPLESMGPDQHAVFVHVNPGETLSVRVGNELQHIPGPATVRMVSQSQGPPGPLPLHVPPGHVVQQIVDETGALKHLILSPQQPYGPGPLVDQLPLNGSASPISYIPLLPSTASSVAGHVSPSLMSFVPIEGSPNAQLSSSPTFGGPQMCAYQSGNVPQSQQHSSSSNAKHNSAANATAYSGGGGSGHHFHHPHYHGRSNERNYNDDYEYGDNVQQQRYYEGRNRRRFNNPRTPRGSGRIYYRNSRDEYYSGGNVIVNNNGTNSHGLNAGSNSAYYGSSPTASASGSYSNRVAQSEPESNVESIDNEEKAKLIELLSKIQAPKLVDVESREALIQWQRIDCSEACCGPFPEIEASDFDYEVFLSEHGADGKYTVIFKGDATEHHLTDLRPATEYFVKIRAVIEPWRGNLTDPIKFRTKPCRPDKPTPVRVSNRTKTTITAKWNSTTDNGSRITSFHLESDQGQPIVLNPTAAAAVLSSEAAEEPKTLAAADSKDGFTEVYRGLEKQFRITKLNAGCTYRLRLAASNELGKSDYSDVFTASTAGNAPAQPDPPQLLEAEPYSLHITWQKRPGDVDFILQMDDPQLNYGFITVCNGSELSCICSELRHSQVYHFRLRAVNDDGESLWSETVSYRTRPAKPSPPGKPYPKGRIQATSLKIAWDPPGDSGGSEVRSYLLESSLGGCSGDNSWAVLYAGAQLEHNALSLSPGKTYYFRVSCSSDGGQSPLSEVLAVTTLPVAPGPCQAPTLHTKPKANSLHLKWGAPEQTGGAEVTQYEVYMSQPDGGQQTLSPGLRCDCAVAGLSPGHVYSFRVRAHNKAGPGAWSEQLEVTTAPGPPDAPTEIKCQSKSANSVLVSWQEPSINGASITEYRLQMAAKKLQQHKLSTSVKPRLEGYEENVEIHDNADDSNAKAEAQSETAEQQQASGKVSQKHLETAPLGLLPGSVPSSTSSSPRHRPRSLSGASSVADASNASSDAQQVDGFATAEFAQVFAGLTREFEVRNLKPATEYAFRLQAANSAGPSKFSALCCCVTPPAAPSTISTLKAEPVSTTEISISWDEPNCNGSGILGYKVEVNITRDSNYVCLYSVDVGSETFEYNLENLEPDTQYRIRILAFNDIGLGNWSSGTKVSTYSPPPKPPNLECISIGCNTLKIRMVDQAPTQELLTYCLEMENRNGRFSPVYEGTNHIHKVTRLNECTAYQFRVRATNACGHTGAWSEIVSFATSRMPPSALKSPPKISYLGSNSWQVEWMPVKTVLPAPERISYTLQLNNAKQGFDDYKTVYMGPSTCFTLAGLEPDTTYRVRVCVVRVTPCAEGEVETPGSYSLVASFFVPSKPENASDHFGKGGGSAVAGHLGGGDFVFRDSVGIRQTVLAIARGEQELTERQFAALVLIGFSTIALLIAFAVQHFIAGGPSSS